MPAGPAAPAGLDPSHFESEDPDEEQDKNAKSEEKAEWHNHNLIGKFDALTS